MKHVILASLLLAAACGSKSKPADTTAGGGGGEGAGGEPQPNVALEAANWEQMDHETQEMYMAKFVLPEMKALFTSVAPEEFAEMDCTTCHGEGAKDHKFEMPNPELPQLTRELIMNPDEDHKQIVEFMQQQVTPKMAALLGKQPWAPENPEGFGCGGCHTFAQ